MKKLVLCLVLILCLFGCFFNNYVDFTVKNNTDVEQVVSFVYFNNEYTSDVIYPSETKSYSVPSGYYPCVQTQPPFDVDYRITTENNIKVIKEDTQKTSYTVINELPFDITLQNFDIINDVKSNPCYSFKVLASSTTNVKVHPKWMGSLWDLQERNITLDTEYLNIYTQSIISNDKLFYYEIIITDTDIIIRCR